MEARVPKFLHYAVLIASSIGLSPVRAEQVVFRNELRQCMTIETTRTWTESIAVLANALIRIHKPIGECGCLSALAIYATSVAVGKARQTLQEGLIGLEKSGEKTLVLATEPALVSEKKISIRLSCAGPL